MGSNFLQRSRHGTVYYFRRRVPKYLRADGVPTQIFRSLHTANRREAIVRARALAVEFDQIFDQFRRQMTKKSDTVRIDYAIELALDDLGRASGVKIDAEPHETDAVCAVVATAVAGARARGVTAPAAALPVAGPTLGEAIRTYRAQGDVKPRTARRYAPALQRLEAYFGSETKLRAITQSRFAEYTRGIKAESGPALATKNHAIKVAGRLFTWCRSQYDDAPTISAVSLKLKRDVPVSHDRAAFTVDELRVLLNEAKPFLAKEPHKFWITALAIFTGARAEELAQLDIQTDIGRDAESGYWFIHIHGERGERQDPRRLAESTVAPGAD